MNKIFKAYVKTYRLTRDNAAEFFDIADEIYTTPEFQSMGKYFQHADITRIQHIMSVAYMSYLWSKKRKMNYISATRAAMMHDLFYYDWHAVDDGSHRLHGYRHPGFALKNAKALFELSPLEENIILRHMWPLTPTPPKYRESFVVCLSDKYCAVQEIIINKFPALKKRFDNELQKNGG